MIPALVFSSVKMPRAGRLQKFAAQQLQNSAKATGQTSLAVYFQRPDNDPVRLDDEKTGTIAVTSSSSAGLQEEAAQVAEVPLPSTASVYADPWIKQGLNLLKMKRFSVRTRGDTVKQIGSRSTNGYGIIVQSVQFFVVCVLSINNSMITRHSYSRKLNRLVFTTGRKAKSDSASTKEVTTTEVLWQKHEKFNVMLRLNWISK